MAALRKELSFPIGGLDHLDYQPWDNPKPKDLEVPLFSPVEGGSRRATDLAVDVTGMDSIGLPTGVLITWYDHEGLEIETLKRDFGTSPEGGGYQTLPKLLGRLSVCCAVIRLNPQVFGSLPRYFRVPAPLPNVHLVQ